MADYNTFQQKRNIVIGIFVVFGLCALIWMMFIFGELPVFVSKMNSFDVVVQFPTAPGVREKTPVRYCGYQIGKVIAVQAPAPVTDPEGRLYHQVKVTLAISNEYSTIPDNIEIRLVKRSIGSSFVELRENPDETETGFLRAGMDVVQGTVGSANEFIPESAMKKLEILVENIAALAANVDEIVGDDTNQTNFREILANVNEMAQQATKSLKAVEAFSNTGTNTLQNTGEKLDDALVEMYKVLAKINDGQGTVARVINDGMLYENLLDSSRELQMALEQLKRLASEAREKGIKIKW